MNRERLVVTMLDQPTNLIQPEPDKSLDSITKVHQLIIDIEMQITRIEQLRLIIASLLYTNLDKSYSEIYR